LHVIADLGVWSAYVAIPCVLVYFAVHRRDLPFRRIVWLFGAFILACGSTHLMEAIIFWWPAYRLAAVIKVFTAVVSWATVIALVPIIPRALKLRSPEALEREIADRTADLESVNAALHTQVVERQKAEQERQRLLESEQEARRNAERLSNLKDDFLATLSHELRTPINAVVGWAQLLRLGDMSEEDVEQALDVIERNSQIQVQLIDDLLEVSRIIAGKMRLTVQEVDLKEVVLAALATVEPAVTAKNITVLSVLDRESPIVMGDSARLQQVIWNLLSNSVKFTPREGRIELRLERADSHVEVVVADSGEGIQPELLPHVFDRFWQADGSSSRKHGGLGLGLSIVRQLTEMHGGSVRVTSKGPGTGATFVVSLPVTAYRDGSDARSRTTSVAVTSSENYPPLLGGVRVLVVDDEADARTLVRKTLELGRAEVAAAGSVDEALSVFDSFRPHVLVSDIGMPGRDGYALIYEIRSRTAPARDVPAVALTAFAHAADRRRILMSGYQLHIPKPAEPYELIAAVAGLAGKSGTAERV
jgi:signal transduction histidine kinase/ActR/RegA family two-component response regulator